MCNNPTLYQFATLFNSNYVHFNNNTEQLLQIIAFQGIMNKTYSFLYKFSKN